MGMGLAIALMIASNLFGSESAFFNLDTRDDVRIYVLDKDRKDELLSLMITYDKNLRTDEKKEIKQEKALEKLFTVRNSQMSDFYSIFDDYMQSRELRQLSYIKSILKAKSIFTDTEWSNMLLGIDSRIEIQMNEKDKLESIVVYLNEGIEEELKKKIEEEKRALEVSSIMKEINASEVDILKKLLAFNYIEVDLLRNRHTTEEQYDKAFKEYNDLWREYFNLYTSGYMKLSAVTTDNEWKVMKKYTKGLF